VIFHSYVNVYQRVSRTKQCQIQIRLSPPRLMICGERRRTGDRNGKYWEVGRLSKPELPNHYELMKLYEIMMLYEIKILYQFISIMIWVDMNWYECSAVWTWHCSSRAKWICWESLEFVCHFFARGCHLHKTWSLAYWACYSNCSRKPPNIVSDNNSR